MATLGLFSNIIVLISLCFKTMILDYHGYLFENNISLVSCSEMMLILDLCSKLIVTLCFCFLVAVLKWIWVSTLSPEEDKS